MASSVFIMARLQLPWASGRFPSRASSAGARPTNWQPRKVFLAAFFKGVVTTLLATPCSGPFLGAVFGFTLTQPPVITYLLFTCIGLGMAAPYLLIGAFPALVRFLPKPGAWMETFKQAMGFVLLGGVVFIFTFLKPVYVVPTFALLIGLWAGCWWIGRTPLYEGRRKLIPAYLVGIAVAGLVWSGSWPSRYCSARRRRVSLATLFGSEAEGADGAREDRGGRLHGQLVPDVQVQPEIRHQPAGGCAGHRGGRRGAAAGRQDESLQKRSRTHCNRWAAIRFRCWPSIQGQSAGGFSRSYSADSDLQAASARSPGKSGARRAVRRYANHSGRQPVNSLFPNPRAPAFIRGCLDPRGISATADRR